MVPLSAEILTEQVIGDERTAVRRTLRLGVSTYSSGAVAMALILNISERGLLIETVVKLAVGETILVDIPEADACAIRVVWTNNLLAGCEFVESVSTGTVSAAQLKSPGKLATAIKALRAAAANSSTEVSRRETDHSSIQTVVVIVISVISILALTLLLAAIMPL